jgi:Trypsin Inhibitor like cysteine rich domain
VEQYKLIMNTKVVLVIFCGLFCSIHSQDPEPDLEPDPECPNVNEDWQVCGNVCEDRCTNRCEAPVLRPPQTLNATNPDCVPGCYCSRGFIRNSAGDCVDNQPGVCSEYRKLVLDFVV